MCCSPLACTPCRRPENRIRIKKLNSRQRRRPGPTRPNHFPLSPLFSFVSSNPPPRPSPQQPCTQQTHAPAPTPPSTLLLLPHTHHLLFLSLCPKPPKSLRRLLGFIFFLPHSGFPLSPLPIKAPLCYYFFSPFSLFIFVFQSPHSASRYSFSILLSPSLSLLEHLLFRLGTPLICSASIWQTCLCFATPTPYQFAHHGGPHGALQARRPR